MAGLEAYKGKFALVTGAGDGIGETLAKGFAEAGMTVCVQDIREDAARRVAEEIGPAAFPLSADVSDPDSLAASVDTLKARDEPLSLLWLNAGVGAGSPVLGAKPRTLDWAFGVNVLGIIHSANAYQPLMTDEAAPRHVGVTASTAALRKPEGAFPLYATTKHATFAVAEALRGELAGQSIGCTILCPGLLNTKIWDAARARPDRFGGVRRQDPSISGQWDAARSPDVMWPHIVRTIGQGGGYLVCQTDDGDTKMAFEARAAEISASMIDV